jgi:hypothetical protein
VTGVAEGRLATDDEVRRLRLRACIEQWPDCRDDAYGPSCCRFPKVCSPHGNEGYTLRRDLEPERGDERGEGGVGEPVVVVFDVDTTAYDEAMARLRDATRRCDPTLPLLWEGDQA